MKNRIVSFGVCMLLLTPFLLIGQSNPGGQPMNVLPSQATSANHKKILYWDQGNGGIAIGGPTIDQLNSVTSVWLPSGIIQLWMDTAALSNGSLGWDTSGTFENRVLGYNASHTNGDSFSWTFRAPPGTYTVALLGRTDTNRAKIDVTIDGVVAGTQDWYSGSAAEATKTTSITILTNGTHTLALTANGKNASSSDYFMVLIRVEVRA